MAIRAAAHKITTRPQARRPSSFSPSSSTPPALVHYLLRVPSAGSTLWGIRSTLADHGTQQARLLSAMVGYTSFLELTGKGARSHPATPPYQPPPASTTLQEQQASWRAEWEAREARGLDAQVELDRLWAQAHLPSDLI